MHTLCYCTTFFLRQVDTPCDGLKTIPSHCVWNYDAPKECQVPTLTWPYIWGFLLLLFPYRYSLPQMPSTLPPQVAATPYPSHASNFYFPPPPFIVTSLAITSFVYLFVSFTLFHSVSYVQNVLNTLVTVCALLNPLVDPHLGPSKWWRWGIIGNSLHRPCGVWINFPQMRWFYGSALKPHVLVPFLWTY